MKSALVTGAFGLVGQHICAALEKKGYIVTRVKFDDLPHWQTYFTFDVIIHSAGYGQPLKFTQDKIKTIEINTKTTNELFRYLKPGGKFLFISSSEVYSGAQSPHKETYIGTTTPQHPRACYIEGKRCGEAICMAYKEQGVDVKIARLALAYGPGTNRGDTRVLNQFIEQALTKGRIIMKDAGEAIRTYIYVDDAVYLMLKVLFEGKDTVYNIGGESTATIRQLADMVGKITNTHVVVGRSGLEGAPSEVKLCLNRIKAEFPFTFLPLEAGLEQTIEYQKELYA